MSQHSICNQRLDNYTTIHSEASHTSTQTCNVTFEGPCELLRIRLVRVLSAAFDSGQPERFLVRNLEQMNSRTKFEAPSHLQMCRTDQTRAATIVTNTASHLSTKQHIIASRTSAQTWCGRAFVHWCICVYVYSIGRTLNRARALPPNDRKPFVVIHLILISWSGLEIYISFRMLPASIFLRCTTAPHHRTVYAMYYVRMCMRMCVCVCVHTLGRALLCKFHFIAIGLRSDVLLMRLYACVCT